MKHSRIAAVAVAFLLPFLWLQLPASAAQAQEPAVLSVTPAIQDRVMAPTEREAQFKISITNNTSAPVTVAVSTTDFTALNQSGGVAFLGEDSSRPFEGHGLSSVLTPDLSTVKLPANSSKDVTVTAKDVPKLAPGGHYAAIIAKVVDTVSGGSSNQLSNRQAISSLVFLETAGQGTKTMNLVSLPDQGTSSTLPSEVNLVFKSTGNTQTVPRGIVTITHGDTEVMRGIINENSSLILPGSTRLLQTELSGDRNPRPSGMYTLRVQYKYDGSFGVTTYEQRFLYINVAGLIRPLLLIILAVVILSKTRRFWLPYASKIRHWHWQPTWKTGKHIVTKILKAVADDIKKLQKEKPEYEPLPARSGARKKQVKK